MEDNDVQQHLRIFEADVDKRPDDKSFIFNEDLNYDLWIDDTELEDEGKWLENGKGYTKPRNADVPELDDRDQYIASSEHYSEDAVDQCIRAKVNIPSNNGHIKATVKQRKADEEGNPVRKSSSNPLLDTQLYVIEYSDGTLR